MMVILSPDEFLYDEPYYVEYPIRLADQGFSQAYVRALEAPAGPLNGLVHGIGMPVWGANVIGMRVTNYLFFLISCFLLYLTARRVANHWNWNTLPLMFGIPFIGVCYSLALTEVPALCFLTASIYLFTRSGIDSDLDNGWRGMPELFLAGLCLGFALWGRQNYIVLIPVAVTGMMWAGVSWYKVFAFMVPVVAMASWLLMTWNGLVPPAVAFVAEDAGRSASTLIIGGLSIKSLMLSLSYVAIVFWLLFPSYQEGSWRVQAGLAAVSLLIVWNVPELQLLPSQFLFEQIWGADLSRVAAICFGALFLALALWLSVCTCRNLWGRRTSVVYLFTGLSWLAICVSNMKILHQFSSRYVVVAAPLILLHGMQHDGPGKWFPARVVIGFSISSVLALNYYSS